jgi:hypothetical protein
VVVEIEREEVREGGNKGGRTPVLHLSSATHGFNM